MSLPFDGASANGAQTGSARTLRRPFYGRIAHRAAFTLFGLINLLISDESLLNLLFELIFLIKKAVLMLFILLVMLINLSLRSRGLA